MWKGLRYQRSDGPASVTVGMVTGNLSYLSFLLSLVMTLGSVLLAEGGPLRGEE